MKKFAEVIAGRGLGAKREGTASADDQDSPGVQDPRSGDIMRLAVVPSQRGSGYGRQLMVYAEEQLVMAGASVARLSIVAQFTRLREYYQQQGYSQVDVRRVPSLPFELMFMEKHLQRGPRGT